METVEDSVSEAECIGLMERLDVDERESVWLHVHVYVAMSVSENEEETVNVLRRVRVGERLGVEAWERVHVPVLDPKSDAVVVSVVKVWDNDPENE